MRTAPSIVDWIDARAALPGLLSEIAFGQRPVSETAPAAAAALRTERPMALRRPR